MRHVLYSPHGLLYSEMQLSGVGRSGPRQEGKVRNRNMHISMSLGGVKRLHCAKNDLDLWQVRGWGSVHVLDLSEQVVQMLFCNTDSSTVDTSFSGCTKFWLLHGADHGSVVFLMLGR